MDTLRGQFGSGFEDDVTPLDEIDDFEAEAGDPPPPPIGRDERRMQVRAYNHWAALLGDRPFPLIEDLDLENTGDFGPYSVLLDFTAGIENPAVQHLGASLADECGIARDIASLSDVPSRSLLSRITDHYMQILANEAPIGFEAEFVNQRGATILYRGILLPFSSDGETIDFIYGAINWKEMADAAATDELLLQIDQALEPAAPNDSGPAPETDRTDLPAPALQPLADWADGPAADGVDAPSASPVASLSPLSPDDAADPADRFAVPSFGSDPYDEDEDVEDDDEEASYASLMPAHVEIGEDREADPVELEPAVDEPADDVAADEPGEEAGVSEPGDRSLAATPDQVDTEAPVDQSAQPESLHDWLAEARELAVEARSSEDRSRRALYDAVGRAYDFSLAAAEEPDSFARLLEENDLAVQDRAPMTPVVKLVFGASYDKTRLTEYAAVLAHAHRHELERGTLGEYLRSAEGGLKGVVRAERAARRADSGAEPKEQALPPKLAAKLRALDGAALDTLDPSGPEFSVVLVRRDGEGGIAMLGEIDETDALAGRVARAVLANAE